MKEKLKKLLTWLRKNVFNKDMFLSFVIAEIIFWSPCIVLGILAIVIDAKFWAWFGAVCAFWASPFTPAVPLQVGLAILIKKLSKKLKRKKNKNNSDVQA